MINLLSCTPYNGRVTIFGDKAWVEIVTEGNVDKGKPAILTLCTGTDEPCITETCEATDTLRQIADARAAAISGTRYPCRVGPAFRGGAGPRSSGPSRKSHAVCSRRRRP